MAAESHDTDARWIVEVREADFEREVLERSRETPVVVDFWAPWCEPCRTLGPLLERLADEYAGAFVLAKVDIDAAPALAQSFGVRSIPAVLGMRDGAIVGSFLGAKPEPEVRAFLARVLPGEADRLARAAEALVAEDDLAGAEAKLREALEHDSRAPRALLALARLLGVRGARDEALALVERVVPTGRWGAEADRLSAELRTRTEAGAGMDLDALRARVEKDPASLADRLELGHALGAAGRHEEALTELLEVVKRDKRFDDEAARKAMLDLFTVIGPDHELTARFRAELSRALFR